MQDRNAIKYSVDVKNMEKPQKKKSKHVACKVVVLLQVFKQVTLHTC